MNDRQFLAWVHDRLLYVYKDHDLADFMHKLRSIAMATDPAQDTPARGDLTPTDMTTIQIKADYKR